MNNPYIEMKSRLPSLSRAGYISEPKAVAKRLFEYFMLSLYSQSTVYYGNISSLAYVYYLGKNEIRSFTNHLEQTLGDYYGRFYDVVNISVTDVSGELETRVTVQLSLVLGDGINSFSLDTAINITEGVIGLSNFGDI